MSKYVMTNAAVERIVTEVCGSGKDRDVIRLRSYRRVVTALSNKGFQPARRFVDDLISFLIIDRCYEAALIGYGAARAAKDGLDIAHKFLDLIEEAKALTEPSPEVS